MNSPADQRSNVVRRSVSGLGMHGGEVQESKIWAQVGKGLCVWLIWKHAELLIDHENTLFVLLLFIILPELIKKFITMRWGAGAPNYVRRTETSESLETNKGAPFIP